MRKRAQVEGSGVDVMAGASGLPGLPIRLTTTCSPGTVVLRVKVADSLYWVVGTKVSSRKPLAFPGKTVGRVPKLKRKSEAFGPVKPELRRQTG